MFRRGFVLSVISSVLGLAGSAMGADYVWNPEYPWAGFSWCDPWAWVGGPWPPGTGVPGPGDTVIINSPPELGPVVDCNVVVGRIKGPIASASGVDQTMYVVKDVNFVVEESWEIDGTGGGTATIVFVDDVKVALGNRGNYSMRFLDGSRVILNLADNAEVILPCDLRAPDDGNDYMELNMTGSAYMSVGNCDEGFRMNEGVILVDVNGSAVFEAKEIRLRARSDGGYCEFNVSEHAQVNITEGQFRFAGGSSDVVINIADNAVVNVAQDLILGEDNDFTATCTLNMSGQLLAIGGYLELINDGAATGSVTVNLTGGLIKAGAFTHETGNWMLDICGSGVMVLQGDVRADIFSKISTGHVTACGGDRVVNVDLVDGNTVVTASGPVYHVDGADGNDLNDGLSPETAFEHIQRGIDEANDGDTVLVWPGVYMEELDFLGKAITVKGSDEPAVLRGAEYYAVSFYHGEDSNSILENFIVRDSNTAFLFVAASPTVSNVTVVDCNAGAVADGGADPDIRNSIFWDNTYGDLFGCEVRYSCIQHSTGGEGNCNSNPLFADANGGDYHLLSEYGRYSSEHGVWMLDAVTSPCVDGGDPNDDYDYEPLPNGSRINMGAYGGTTHASMSEWAAANDIYPANYAENMCRDVTINWPRDEFVVYHRVYFGTSLSDVNAGATAVETDWEPNSRSPGDLELGATYYWRIEGVNDTNVHSPWPGFVRRFATNDGNAFDPYPADNQTVVPLDAQLCWSPGCLAASHDVYFSTDFNDVNDRSPGAFQGNQLEAMFDPCGLDYYAWYYWRVDEVNDGNAWPGKVWSFRTHDVIIDPNRVLGYRFDETDGNIAHDSSGYERHGFVAGPGGEPYWRPTSGFSGGCLAFLNDTVVTVPTDTLSGINHGITIGVWLKHADPEGGDNWVFDAGAGEYRVQAKVVTKPEPNVFWRAGNDANDILTWDLNGIEPGALEDWNLWIFVKDENAGTMGVYLNAWAPFRGFGNACAILSKEGVDKTLVNVRNSPFKVGALTNQDHDFTGKMDDFTVFDYAMPESSFGCPLPTECAWHPQPASGQQDVPPDVVLKWLPGDYALSHDVYLGTGWDAVNDADTSSSEYKGRYGPNEYDPGGNLELDKTYYWRIDEINEPEVWKCLVWEFTTANFLVVDDMESYDAVPAGGNQIWDTWDDGFNNYTGSQLVLEYGSGAVIHGGDQSMTFEYQLADLLGGYAEVDANTAGPRPGNLKIGNDWTAEGVKVLTLFFYGQPDNDATQPMYVVLEDGAYDFVMVRYGDHGEDPNDIREAEWHECNIPLSEFADGGVELADVSKVRIGFGDRMNPVAGGSGIVYFDDIRLYPPRCVWPGPAGDLNCDCLVNYVDLKIIASQWLCTGDCTQQLYPDDKVDFKDYVVLAENWLADTRWPQ